MTRIELALAASDVSTDLSWWKALILGLVEGLTEYLPVSSTGHLLFTADLLGLTETPESEAAVDTFAVCIQAGAIAAVLFLYWPRIRSMIDGILGRSAEGARVLLTVLVAFIPTGLIGLVARSSARDSLFAPGPIIAAWLVGGLAIVWLVRADFFNRGHQELQELTVKNAVLIGLAQALAIWPGVSRSLVTIVAAVAVGLTLRAAVEFSFLLGVVTLAAATVYEAARTGDQMLETFGWFTPLLGLLIAFVSAVAAVKWMVAQLEAQGFIFFGWYRIAAAVAGVIIVLTTGV